MANNAETKAARPALLLTRPRQSAARFAASLDPAVLDGVTVCLSPLIEIVPLAAEVDLTGAAGVIFSSAHGVAHGPVARGLPAHCVGKRTAEAALAAGWQPGVVADEAEALIPQLAKTRGPLVHIAGTHRRGEIAQRLSALGVATRAAVVYDQPLRPLNAQAKALLAGGTPVIIPLFSPRTARQFAAETRPAAHLYLVGMSAAVLQALGRFEPAHLHTMPNPTAQDMRRGVEKLLRGDSFA